VPFAQNPAVYGKKAAPFENSLAVNKTHLANLMV